MLVAASKINHQGLVLALYNIATVANTFIFKMKPHKTFTADRLNPPQMVSFIF